MNNEHLAIVLKQYRSRLSREIDILNAHLAQHDLEQETERIHHSSETVTCDAPRDFLGYPTAFCKNEAHYHQVANGIVICLNDLRVLVDELDEHIEMLRAGQAEV